MNEMTLMFEKSNMTEMSKINGKTKITKRIQMTEMTVIEMIERTKLTK